MDYEKEYWHELLEITKIIYLTGFIKSVVGTILISTGIGVFINAFVNPQWYDHAYLVGLVAILAGFLSYFYGDWYKQNRAKDQLEIIQDANEEYIKSEAERIARLIVEEEEKKKKEAIKRRFDEIEQGICSDVIEIADIDGKSVKYCKTKLLNPDNNTIAYPDTFPAKTIVDIAVAKINGMDLIANPERIKENLQVLFESQLISEKKLRECLTFLENGNGR
jgi:hypothetical protein